MGLDMYLRGRKHPVRYYEAPEKQRREDGYRVSNLELELGYWRKHPDLHGYIVQEYGGGTDECQEIDLAAEQLQGLIAAVERGPMPATTGFFFGTSDYWYAPERVASTAEVLRGALAWLQSAPESEWRSVYYQASW